MFLHVIVTISIICCSGAFAEKNFWDNEVCHTDSDCSGLLTECNSTFGCTVSGTKAGIAMVAVILTLCAIIIGAVACCCRGQLTNFRSRQHNRHNQYVPQTVMTSNPTPWNQHQMATTAVYPHNPYPNQFYANSVNQPMYNEYQIDPRLGATTNFGQNVPTAPYPPAGYDYGQGYAPQTHYPKH